jgi:predicted transcriptional regulator of viral defense system
MDYKRLLEIGKLYFSHEDVADLLAIKKESAAVLCARYVKKGLLTRLKRDLYVRTETLAHLAPADLYRIANLLQVPSYVSLMTALSYYGVSTQVQRGFVENVSIKRTKAFTRGGISFRYVKVSSALYGGFVKEQGAFIASPEKALLDSIYLSSMGRYTLDVASLDLSKVDRKKLIRLAGNYPSKTQNFLERLYEETGRSREL